MDMDDPLRKAFDLAPAAKTKLATIIGNIIRANAVFADQPVQETKEKIRSSSSTLGKLYLTLNPNLETHNVYTKTEVKEYQRISFSRFRLRTS